MRPGRRPIRRAAIRGRAVRRPVTRRVARRVGRRTWRRTRRIIVGTSVLLLIGGSSRVVKVESNEVQKIEAETGKSVDDLTEAELAAAMRKLGIQSMQVTSQDEVEISRFEEKNHENETPARFCSYCGKEISIGTKYCPECGAKL